MNKLILLAAPLALAACGDTAEVSPDPESQDTGAAAAPVDAFRASEPSAEPTSVTASKEKTIPPALQGRWGMVAADCTSTRGDAKGLLTISPTTLKFYESVGQLGGIVERTGNSIRAQYAFTGEGMEWTRDIALSVTGDTLTRLDRGGEEPGGPFSYTRCPS